MVGTAWHAPEQIPKGGRGHERAEEAQNRNVYYPYRIIRTLINNNTVLHEVEYIGGTVVVNLNELFWNNLAHVNFIPDFIKAHVRALKVPAKAARPMPDGYG